MGLIGAQAASMRAFTMEKKMMLLESRMKLTGANVATPVSGSSNNANSGAPTVPSTAKSAALRGIEVRDLLADLSN